MVGWGTVQALDDCVGQRAFGPPISQGVCHHRLLSRKYYAISDGRFRPGAMPGGAASAVAALDLGIGHWAIAKDALAARAPALRWAPDHGAGRLAVPVPSPPGHAESHPGLVILTGMAAAVPLMITRCADWHRFRVGDRHAVGSLHGALGDLQALLFGDRLGHGGAFLGRPVPLAADDAAGGFHLVPPPALPAFARHVAANCPLNQGTST